jgi:hypothetical protein
MIETSSAVQTPVPNFDRLAHLYRWMEMLTFGTWLHRCRCAFLGDLAACRNAVVLGDGDGRFTAELVRANPKVQIDAVDASPAMLGVLLRRAGPDAAGVRTYCADARSWRPVNPPYDLVVTHFFLDCLTTEEIRAVAGRMRGAISPSAVWVVTEFAIPRGWLGQFLGKPLIWMLYRAFGLLTGLAVRALPDHSAALRDAGYRLERSQTRLHGLLVSEIWRVNKSTTREQQMLQTC